MGTVEWLCYWRRTLLRLFAAAAVVGTLVVSLLVLSIVIVLVGHGE